MLRIRQRKNYHKRKGTLEVDLQNSDFHKGVRWERYVADKYFKNARMVSKEEFYGRDPYDLETEIGLVDVKSVNAWVDMKRNRSARWHFWVRPTYKKFIPEYYFFVCLDDEIVVKCYLIPGKLAGCRLSLGDNSPKWDQYKI